MHGVICETTKLGNANTDACDLIMNKWNEIGIFSFSPENYSGNEIRCSRSLKVSGIEVVSHQAALK